MVHERIVDHGVVLTPQEPPHRWGLHSGLGARLMYHLVMGRTRIIINLTHIIHLDPIMVGELMTLLVKCRQAGGYLRLCEASPTLAQSLFLFGDNLFADEGDALCHRT